MPDIANEEYVSQFVGRGPGSPRPPQCMPRERDTDGLSAIRGRVSPAEAGRLVRTPRRRAQIPLTFDGVRYASVAELRQAGFEVHATPSRRNPSHVSITYRGVWDQHAASMFEACFGEPVWHGEGGVDDR